MCALGVLQIWMGSAVFLMLKMAIMSAVDETAHQQFEQSLSKISNTTELTTQAGNILKWSDENTHNSRSHFANSSSVPTGMMTSTTLSTVPTEVDPNEDAATVTATTSQIPVTTRTTTFPTLEGDVYLEEDAEREKLRQIGDVGDFGDRGGGDGNVFSDRTIFEGKPKAGLFERIKSIFKPSMRNNVLAHAMEAGTQFREKYGSSNIPGKQAPYGEEGGGGYYSGAPYSNYGEQMIPDGAFAPVYKPAVTLTLTADFIELNCATHGRIQHNIRWVKLVGLNPYGHHLFATVADGDRILFDNYHFAVRTDGKNSRLIIRNPDPKIHYGVYQCQASVAGNPSIIVKEDFVVGRVK